VFRILSSFLSLHFSSFLSLFLSLFFISSLLIVAESWGRNKEDMQAGSKPLTDVLLTFSFVTVPNLEVPQSRTMDKTFRHKITMPTTTKTVDKENKSED